MQTYTITITELQRLALLEALVSAFGEATAASIPGDSYLNQGPIMRDLLQQLPLQQPAAS